MYPKISNHFDLRDDLVTLTPSFPSNTKEQRGGGIYKQY